MNAVSYLRISVKDQSTYSLENQERQINMYCRQHNLELVAMFKDDGESSYSFDRPDWKKLEAFIRKNKSVEYLIISDHDRFSRNLGEAILKVKELYDKYSIKVLATSDSFNTDFEDNSAWMTRAFKFMIAENELHNIRKRTKAGYVQASLKGLYVNKAPYGYTNARNEAGQPTLIIDENKAQTIRLIFQEYNRGSTIEEVKEIAQGYGYTQKGSSAIQRILTNPVYAGLVKVPPHGGKPETTVTGIHQAIISEADYWQAVNRITGNQRIGVIQAHLPLKGVLTCHLCGQVMSSSNPKSKSGKTFWYYICSKHRKNLSANKLHAQLGEILDAFSYPEKKIQLYSKEISKEISQHLLSRGEILSKTKKAIRQVEDKISISEEKYLLGDVNKKSYDKVISSLKMQEKELAKRMHELEQDQNVYWQKLSVITEALHNVRATYEKMDLYRKQQFLKAVFERELTHDGTCFRTPKLLKDFSHNELILKEKGLLIIEKPSNILGDSPYRTAYGTCIEHLTRLADILAA